MSGGPAAALRCGRRNRPRRTHPRSRGGGSRASRRAAGTGRRPARACWRRPKRARCFASPSISMQRARSRAGSRASPRRASAPSRWCSAANRRSTASTMPAGWPSASRTSRPMSVASGLRLTASARSAPVRWNRSRTRRTTAGSTTLSPTATKTGPRNPASRSGRAPQRAASPVPRGAGWRAKSTSNGARAEGSQRPHHGRHPGDGQAHLVEAPRAHARAAPGAEQDARGVFGATRWRRERLLRGARHGLSPKKGTSGRATPGASGP